MCKPLDNQLLHFFYYFLLVCHIRLFFFFIILTFYCNFLTSLYFFMLFVFVSVFLSLSSSLSLCLSASLYPFLQFLSVTFSPAFLISSFPLPPVMALTPPPYIITPVLSSLPNLHFALDSSFFLSLQVQDPVFLSSVRQGEETSQFLLQPVPFGLFG